MNSKFGSHSTMADISRVKNKICSLLSMTKMLEQNGVLTRQDFLRREADLKQFFQFLGVQDPIVSLRMQRTISSRSPGLNYTHMPGREQEILTIQAAGEADDILLTIGMGSDNEQEYAVAEWEHHGSIMSSADLSERTLQVTKMELTKAKNFLPNPKAGDEKSFFEKVKDYFD